MKPNFIPVICKIQFYLTQFTYVHVYTTAVDSGYAVNDIYVKKIRIHNETFLQAIFACLYTFKRTSIKHSVQSETDADGLSKTS